MLNREDNYTPSKPTYKAKFEIGQVVMVRNHSCWTFEPKYLMVYRVLKIGFESILLLVTPNGKVFKMNINSVKPCTTLEQTEDAWNLLLNSIKSNCKTMCITWDLMANFNTYNINSIATRSLPTFIKYPHQSLETKAPLPVHTSVQHLPYTVTVSALHL